ncbi:cytochrome P450 [Edaphosphingomonas haloaromaticamans]|uniref:Pentalenene oxygenase n=1 Tax=Edaphosphingomonas haloaromaticamans TaxID=653954 RepID=A0A1S1H977_9SPHN|nr:cytochrome P450 [Sphingomonas haloaromaticamans]OHT18196.1 Pentalenene oxygenase [Sphingomonas haloaromaticamans]
MNQPRFSGAYTDAANWLYRMAREHNGENVRAEVNGADVLLVQRLEDAEHVLRRRADNYRKNMHWFRHMLGPSRFSEVGEAWEIRRELTQHYLAKFDRERTHGLAVRYADEAVGALAGRSAAGDAVLDESLLRRMTVSVLIENFFGVPLAETRVDIDRLATLMEFGSEYAFAPTVDTSALNHRHLAALPRLRREIFDDFRLFREGALPDNPMLEGMLAADRDPENDIMLEHELLTFFAAGAETTASGIGWACYLLARHPDVQRGLRDALAPFWESLRPDWAHLSTIAPLEAFVSEALRLYPPTPLVTRLATGPDRIGDHAIAEGDNIFVSIPGVQHDARLHTDPWALHLDRYRNNASAGSNIAFIFGPRVCGGKKFALVELAAFVATFLKRADFALTSDAPPRFHWKSLMLREGGQPVRVTLRD